MCGAQVEYKNEEESLEAAQVLDGSAVFVQLGRPMKADEYKVGGGVCFWWGGG